MNREVFLSILAMDAYHRDGDSPLPRTTGSEIEGRHPT